MVQLKLDSTGIDPTQSNGFEPYEGPLPRPGAYAAVIRSCKIRVSQAGNPYINVLLEFANQVTPEKQVFKAFPLWDKIVPGDSDIQKERVGKFLYAVCGKVKANIEHEEIADGGTVKKVGGKDPIGTRCRVVVRRGSYNGEPQAELADLFPWPKDQEWPEEAPDGSEVEDEEIEDEEAEEADEPDEDEEESDEEESEDEAEDDEEEDDGEFEARQAELAGMDRTALKTALKAVDPEFRVLKRHTDDELREAILDVEFPVDSEEDDEEEGDDEPPF